MGRETGVWPWEDVGNLTATALLGWFAWFTATRTIPSLVRSFREELKNERQEFRRDREVFREELAEERMQRHADSMGMAEALHELTAELRASRK